jgi:hypothetical protein
MVEHRHTTFGNVVILLFLLAQAADGVLTYLGVQAFGRSIEANPMLAWLMHVVGDGPALAAAKLVAASLGATLHVLTVHRLVAALAGFYLLAAVGPWLYLLFFAPVRALLH